MPPAFIAVFKSVAELTGDLIFAVTGEPGSFTGGSTLLTHHLQEQLPLNFRLLSFWKF
jgi:hypothetical protein